MTKKETKTDLARKLREALAGQAYVYAYASEAIEKAGTEHLMASGAVVTITALGGREIVAPVLIRDGLSAATIAAFQADLLRSYELATLRKPKGKRHDRED